MKAGTRIQRGGAHSLDTLFKLLLVSALVFQPSVAVSQESRLREILHDIPGEAERYLSKLPETDRDWVSDGHRNQEDVESARLRARIQNLPLGSDITIVNRGGERFAGTLEEADFEQFRLAVKDDTRNFSVGKLWRYDEVDTAVLPVWNGWMDLEEIRTFKTDQKLELLLVNGTKVQGRLASVLDDELFLRSDRNERQQFALDEIATVRKLGMSRLTKALIVTGVAVGTLAVLGALAIRSLRCNNCNFGSI